MNESIIILKLVANAVWSGRDIAKLHFQHAEASHGKVVVTTGNRIASQRRDALKQAILYVPGHPSILADLVDAGDAATGLPRPEGFTSPSVFAVDDKPFWVALENLRWINIEPGDYQNGQGAELVDLLSGRNSLSYANRVI